jgi:uncharacterized protein YraI
MNMKMHHLRFSARALFAVFAALFVVFEGLSASVPALASSNPGSAVGQVAQAGIGAFAKVTERIAPVWAGPARGFWAIGQLRRGQLVPVVGVSSDGQWWQVNTNFGVGFVWAAQVQTGNTGGVPTANIPPIATITQGLVTVRELPGPEARAIGSLSRGSKVFIIGGAAATGWLRIKWHFGTGWINGDLAETNATSLSLPTREPRAVVNAGSVNIRTGPSFLFSSMGTVPGGVSMRIIGRSRDGIWLQVESPVGVGWVNINHVITRDYFGSAPITEP